MRTATASVTLALVVLLGVALVATVPSLGERAVWRNDPQLARDLAERLLNAASMTLVRRPDEDRGWHLLHPDARATFGDRDHYLRLADGSDWSDFRR